MSSKAAARGRAAGRCSIDGPASVPSAASRCRLSFPIAHVPPEDPGNPHSVRGGVRIDTHLAATAPVCGHRSRRIEESGSEGIGLLSERCPTRRSCSIPTSIRIFSSSTVWGASEQPVEMRRMPVELRAENGSHLMAAFRWRNQLAPRAVPIGPRCKVGVKLRGVPRASSGEGDVERGEPFRRSAGSCRSAGGTLLPSRALN